MKKFQFYFGSFLFIIAAVFTLFKFDIDPIASIVRDQVANVQLALLPDKDSEGNLLYKGKIEHIFFHSLIVYPDLAFNNNVNSQLFKDYMITRDEFQKILPQLYQNNYILIDIAAIYNADSEGNVTRKALYLPEGKKPLIISIDDLSYYSSRKGSGFADKLVLDENGEVATEIVTPDGVKITKDGDLVPLLDNFVRLHPDFSFKGAKGVIAVTGFDGVLGYRTQRGSTNRERDSVAAKIVIDKLKNTGWRFASHSYYHNQPLRDGNISLEDFKNDVLKWEDEVQPLVGDTNIFIGPFGQIFKPGDPRREVLISQGFKMLCGVGMDVYLKYFGNYVVMNRADIDGYRITHNPNLLKKYFDVEKLK